MDPGGLRRAVTEKTKAVIPVRPLRASGPHLGVPGCADPLEEGAWSSSRTRRRRSGPCSATAARPSRPGRWATGAASPSTPRRTSPPAARRGSWSPRTRTGRSERGRCAPRGRTRPIATGILSGNGRLDAIEAAVLRVRLQHLEEWNERRRRNASLYTRLLEESGLLGSVPGFRLPPAPGEGEIPNWHQFTVRAPRRDELKTRLADRGIQTGVYYPIPVSLQPVFSQLGYRPGDFPAAEEAAREVLSLPIHQHLQPGDVERVVAEIADFYRA